MNHILTENQRTTITNACRVAADRFTEYVRDLTEQPETTRAERMLAEQFVKQATEARAMADLVDGVDEIEFKGVA